MPSQSYPMLEPCSRLKLKGGTGHTRPHAGLTTRPGRGLVWLVLCGALACPSVRARNVASTLSLPSVDPSKHASQGSRRSIQSLVPFLRVERYIDDMMIIIVMFKRMGIHCGHDHCVFINLVRVKARASLFCTVGRKEGAKIESRRRHVVRFRNIALRARPA